MNNTLTRELDGYMLLLKRLKPHVKCLISLEIINIIERLTCGGIHLGVSQYVGLLLDNFKNIVIAYKTSLELNNVSVYPYSTMAEQLMAEYHLLNSTFSYVKYVKLTSLMDINELSTVPSYLIFMIREHLLQDYIDYLRKYENHSINLLEK